MSITTFKCNPVDASGTELKGSTQLYANGLHQIKIRIIIQKQLNGINSPLTLQEKDSIRLVRRGSTTLPEKWTSTTTNNGYTLGLRTNNLSPVQPIMDMKSLSSDSTYDTIYYYLSTSDITLEAQDIEATIISEGTESRSGDAVYNYNYITIKPVAPYFISSTELIRKEDHKIHFETKKKKKKKNKYTDLTVIYWTLPYTLTIASYVISGSRYSNNQFGISFSASGDDPAKTLYALDNFTTTFSAPELGAAGYNGTVTLTTGAWLIRASKASVDNYQYTDSRTLPTDNY